MKIHDPGQDVDNPRYADIGEQTPPPWSLQMDLIKELDEAEMACGGFNEDAFLPRLQRILRELWRRGTGT